MKVMKFSSILCIILFIATSALAEVEVSDNYDDADVDHVIENLDFDLEYGLEIRKIGGMVDVLLEQLKAFMMVKGFYPMKVPDFHRNFSYKPLLISFHGEIDLKNGWLQNATTIYRSGEPSLIYANKIITVQSPLGFKNFLLVYEYSAKIMSLGPSGSIEGVVKDVQVNCKLSIDFGRNMHITLNDFTITQIGKINLQFRGSYLLDWLINIFSGIITTIFNGLITVIVEATIRGIIEEIINGFNDRAFLFK